MKNLIEALTILSEYTDDDCPDCEESLGEQI